MRIDSNLVNASQKAWDEQFFHGKVPLKVALNKVAKQMQRMIEAGYTISDVKDQLNDWWGLNDQDEKVTEAMIRHALAVAKKNKRNEKTGSKKSQDKDQENETTDAPDTSSASENNKDDVAVPETGEKNAETTKTAKNRAYDLQSVHEWRESDNKVILSEPKALPMGAFIRLPSGGRARVIYCKPTEYGERFNKRDGMEVSYEVVDS